MGKIVVGVDGSDSSKAALHWAVEEARLRSVPVEAIYAYEVPIVSPGLTPAPHLDLVTLVTEQHAAAVQLITALGGEVGGDDSAVTVTPAAIEGPAASVLIDAARDADLLVVGSRGHGGFAELLLGSVSEQCVHHAPCPVLVHRTGLPSAG